MSTDSKPQPDSTASGTTPRHAATAIVVREHAGEVQVLMTRRHASLAFMGGMWVFPGGALAPSDRSEPARKLVVNADTCAHRLLDVHGRALPQDVCLALAIAACRETFEETGVLLARQTNGHPCTEGQLARLQAERQQIAADPELFVAALTREGLRLHIDELVYWSHWITPVGPPRRFDTRFFIARAPEAHEFMADATETSECVWMSPERLLAAAAQGEMKIAQPTRYNLEDLRVSVAKHGSLAAAMQHERERRVAAIMPKLVRQQDKTMILMPWDEAYAHAPGDSVPADQYYEPALLALDSRVERDH
jgi:8-oxo-dGTP pyrophosphatase MutT (NUDIX family)